MVKSINLILVLFVVTVFAVQGQSKKKLKQENAKLKSQVGKLQKQNRQLQQKSANLEKENKQLTNKTGQMQMQLDKLEQNFNAMKQDYNQLKSEYESVQGGGGISNEDGGFVNVNVDVGESEDCGVNSGNLVPGNSYTMKFNKLNLKGWGVQVYSFASLCSAFNKAKEFSSYYKLYNTYIRVKMVNNRKIYSVIYGSLKDEEQARTYCTNFRKIAKDKEGQNAFLVNHASE